MESYEAAEQLASTIRIGSLKVELEEIQSKVVGARLALTLSVPVCWQESSALRWL